MEMHVTELRIVDMIYAHLRLHHDLSSNTIIDNILTYYEIEDIGNFQDIERYLTGIANLTTNIFEESEEEEVEEAQDLYDHLDDIILETGNNNIRFTRVIVNSSRFLPGTSPPSTSASPSRGNRFDDVKVILQKKELDKHPVTPYKNIKDKDCISCTICMEEYDDNSLVRKMGCKHMFHKKCIDKWLLEYNFKCPICRAECGHYEPKL